MAKEVICEVLRFNTTFCNFNINEKIVTDVTLITVVFAFNMINNYSIQLLTDSY